MSKRRLLALAASSRNFPQIPDFFLRRERKKDYSLQQQYKSRSMFCGLQPSALGLYFGSFPYGSFSRFLLRCFGTHKRKTMAFEPYDTSTLRWHRDEMMTILVPMRPGEAMNWSTGWNISNVPSLR